ncbi:hypothetical protein BD626DRAFT_460277 [Schizophyllum amplum]|uniref:Uncharacterized protein n=1 Tax=Schizophyllum amplum TaxID=97359 RepID=A0A550C8C2_9AGAR|nr:hypothetical protein BD626DRAFT_460277 [Auriculariopsis ampla]
MVPDDGYYRPWTMPSSACDPPRLDDKNLPPISRLPAELLSLILLHVPSSQLCMATLSPRATPLVLSHVCGHWRDVAIGLPALWQRLALGVCSRKGRHQHLELARTYVHRAGGQRLSIHYYDLDYYNISKNFHRVVTAGQKLPIPSFGDRCFCTLDFVMEHIAQVEVLHLTIGHLSCHRLSSIRAGAAATLRDLQLHFIEGGEQVSTVSPLYSSAPLLRKLDWTGELGICRIPAPNAVPWSQLVVVHFEESPIGHDAFLNIMAHGGILSTISVRVSHLIAPTLPRSDMVYQDTLVELNVYSDGPLDEVFGRLWLPSLRNLSIEAKGRHSDRWPFTDARTLQQFLSRISYGLDSFSMWPSGTLDEDTLLPILALPQMSTLSSFDAQIPYIGDPFFRQLRPARDNIVPLMPHLKKLVVGECLTSDGVIARMLRSRVKYSYPLQHFQVQFKRSEEGQHILDAALLRQLEAMGFVARDSY